MLVVNVLAVRVPMCARGVGVRVGVDRSRPQAVVNMIVVVPVVMAVRVIVGHPGMLVRVVVGFGQVHVRARLIGLLRLSK